MTLERGTLINNRYRVVEILGQGGMGSVYRAIDENLGVEVALKENLFTTEEYARQFRREAVILATLRHPNLTRVTDHFEIESQGQYLVMDYIEGEDLRQRMDRIGVLNEEEAVIIGAAICDAISYLHTRTPPIVHRDIKPGNVKITPNGQIFLVDFGLAKIIQSGQATTTGARAMTPGYSPPEQYGTARTDNRSDVFSLGATLYAALTGVIPEDALARAMDQTQLTQIRKRNGKVSRRLASVIEKSLAVRPDDRYQNAEEFKQALLSVRGITTSRRNTGDYKVTPPPEGPTNLPSYATDPDPNPGPAVYIPGSRDRSPLPLPPSAPVLEPVSAMTFRSRRRSNLLLLLLAAVLLTLAGVTAYTFYPSWPSQAISLLFPSSLGSSTLTIGRSPTPTHTPTHASQVPVVAPPSPTASPQAGPVVTATPSPSAQPSPTSTLPASPTPTLLPTPMGGGAGQIAFASDRSGTTQIWLMNTDGSGQPVQLTDIFGGACQPNWSPDGERLVFISPCSKNQETYPSVGMFIINADGTQQTPLPGVLAGDFDPAWSPDGTKIVFTSLRNSGRPRLYLLNLEDNSVKRISDLYSRDSQPAWSPDGSKIAFVTNRNGPVQIWTMNPDGSEQQIYTRSADHINTHPVWSTDGETILFTQTEPSGGIPNLVAASYTDGQYTEFAFELGPTPAREARYSPDGLWVVFEGWPFGGNHEIFLVSATGAGRLQLTNWERDDFDPAWRPPSPQP